MPDVRRSSPYLASCWHRDEPTPLITPHAFARPDRLLGRAFSSAAVGTADAVAGISRQTRGRRRYTRHQRVRMALRQSLVWLFLSTTRGNRLAGHRRVSRHKARLLPGGHQRSPLRFAWNRRYALARICAHENSRLRSPSALRGRLLARIHYDDSARVSVAFWA
jgi:hypothetical protein